MAAQIGVWQIASADGITTLTATANTVHAFWITQRPVMFVAPHAEGSWRWPIRSLDIHGQAVTAVLGPMEQT